MYLFPLLRRVVLPRPPRTDQRTTVSLRLGEVGDVASEEGSGDKGALGSAALNSTGVARGVDVDIVAVETGAGLGEEEEALLMATGVVEVVEVVHQMVNTVAVAVEGVVGDLEVSLRFHQLLYFKLRSLSRCTGGFSENRGGAPAAATP